MKFCSQIYSFFFHYNKQNNGIKRWRVNKFVTCVVFFPLSPIILVLKLHEKSRRHTSRWMDSFCFFYLIFFFKICFRLDRPSTIDTTEHTTTNWQPIVEKKKTKTLANDANIMLLHTYLRFGVRHDRLDLIAVYLMAYPSPIHSNFHGPSSFLMKFFRFRCRYSYLFEFFLSRWCVPTQMKQINIHTNRERVNTLQQE